MGASIVLLNLNNPVSCLMQYIYILTHVYRHIYTFTYINIYIFIRHTYIYIYLFIHLHAWKKTYKTACLGNTLALNSFRKAYKPTSEF